MKQIVVSAKSEILAARAKAIASIRTEGGRWDLWDVITATEIYKFRIWLGTRRAIKNMMDI